jgi:hypothetical protein
MFEQAFKNIDNVLWKEAGCTTELDYTARALDRARETWHKHGRSDNWIQQRMTGQETRNKLADWPWAAEGIPPSQRHCEGADVLASTEAISPSGVLGVGNLVLARAALFRRSEEALVWLPLRARPEPQRRLASVEKETRRLESIYRQKVAALDALKKSLLHEAFSGRL